MNYRVLALAIAAFSSAPIATADAQSVYVAPGAVYIGGGPVYVIPPSNGNGPYAEPGYVAPTVVAPGAGYVAPAAVYNGNGSGYYNGNGQGYYNGNGQGYYNGNGPAYYNGAPVVSAYAYGGRRIYVDELAPRPPAAIPFVPRRFYLNPGWSRY